MMTLITETDLSVFNIAIYFFLILPVCASSHRPYEVPSSPEQTTSDQLRTPLMLRTAPQGFELGEGVNQGLKAYVTAAPVLHFHVDEEYCSPM